MKNLVNEVKYAISFDLDVNKLNELYGNSHNNAYGEIRKIMESCNFYNQQGSLYFGETENENAIKCVLVAQKLSRELPWFDKCVKDIRMLRVEDNNDLSEALLSKQN